MTSAFQSPCFLSMGPEGLEPSPTCLRARHAAANTLIPIANKFPTHSQSANWARRESNPRPGPYKRPARTAELRAATEARPIWPSGAEGSRTLTCPLKRRKRCRYATTPSSGVGVCVSVEMGAALLLSLFRVVSSEVVRGGVEPTANDISDRHASVTTPDRSREGGSSNPRSRAPKARGPPLPYLPNSCIASVARMGVEPISPS